MDFALRQVADADARIDRLPTVSYYSHAMRPAPTPTVLEPLPTTPVSAALILFLLAAPIQILTYSLSLLTGARYAWWFPDLPYLLLGVALITLTLGGSMQFALFLAKRLRRS